MKALRARAISAALAVAISLIAITTACVDSQQPQSMPPRAEVAAPAPTSTPTPPEPTPTTAPEPTAAPANTPATAPQSAQSAQSQPAPTAEPVSTAETNTPVEPTPSAPEPTAAPANTPEPAPAQAAPAGSPADVFQSAATAMNALSTYRAEMEQVLTIEMGVSEDMTPAPAPTAEIMTLLETRIDVQADVQAPDKMGGDMTITLQGEPPIANSFVIVGNDAYVSLPNMDNPQNQSWVQSAPADVEATTSFLTWFATGSQYEFSPGELVGTEDLNGEETYRLRGSFTVKNLPTDMEQIENMEADVWVGTSDSLIRKIAAAGERKEEGLKLEIVISYSRFNDAAIQVEAPSDFITP